MPFVRMLHNNAEGPTLEGTALTSEAAAHRGTNYLVLEHANWRRRSND